MVTCMWVRKRRTWSCGVFLYFDYKRDRKEQPAKTLLLFFYGWEDCSTVKDYSYFMEIYLFVSPCFHSDIFFTWGHSHWKCAERVPFISLHRLLNVGYFYCVGFEVAYFDATFYPFPKTWQLNLASESSMLIAKLTNLINIWIFLVYLLLLMEVTLSFNRAVYPINQFWAKT